MQRLNTKRQVLYMVPVLFNSIFSYQLSQPDQFGRGNIIVQRLGHVDKADCLSLLASVCVCLNIACAGLSSFDLLFSKVWERLERSPLSPLSNRTVIGVGLKRPPVAAIVYIWNDFIHTGNALGL